MQKRAIRPLKVGSAPKDEWIRNMADTGSHGYDATPIGELISKSFKKNHNVRCFNCDKPGHLKRNCRHCVPRNNAFSRDNAKRGP